MLVKEKPPRVREHPGGATHKEVLVSADSVVYGDVRDQDHPHACWDGYVYLGYTDEAGEEQIAKLPCRRCVVAKLGEEA